MLNLANVIVVRQLLERKEAPPPSGIWHAVKTVCTSKWMGGFLAAAGFGYGVYLAASRYQRKPEVVFNPQRPESKVDGSDEGPRLEPSCQVRLGYKAAKGYTVEVIGCGFRSEFLGKDYLVTAAHNVAFNEPLFLIKGTCIVELKDYDVYNLGFDSALVDVPQKIWTQMGVSKAKFAARGNTEIYVDVVGCMGNGTSGKLKPADGTIGFVQYSGSTFGGYSGAVYFSGSTVYGMHTTGGRCNMGVAAMFILQAAKIALGEREEHYDRAFFNRLSKRAKNTPSGKMGAVIVGDFVVLEDDMGYYYRIPREDYARYMEDLDDSPALEVSEDFVLENILGKDLNSSSPGTSRAGDLLPLVFSEVEKLLRQLKEIRELTAQSNARLEN